MEKWNVFTSEYKHPVITTHNADIFTYNEESNYSVSAVLNF